MLFCNVTAVQLPSGNDMNSIGFGRIIMFDFLFWVFVIEEVELDDELESGEVDMESDL